MSKESYLHIVATIIICGFGNLSFGQTFTEPELRKLNTQAIQSFKDNPKKSLTLAQANFEALKELTVTPSLKAEITYTLARAHDYNRNLAQALDYYMNSISLLDKLSDYEKLVNVYNAIGGVYYNINEFDRTIEYTLLALKAAESQKLTEELPIVYNNLAGAYRELNEFGKALAYAQKAVQLAKQQKDKEGLLFSLSTVADVHLDTKNYDSSLTYYQKALLIGKNNKLLTPFIESFLKIGIAQNYYQKGDIDRALNYVNDARTLTNSHDILVQKHQAAKVLVDIWNKKNNRDSSFYFQNEMLQLEDSLWSLEEEIQLNRIVIKHRENEILSHKQEVERQKLYSISGILIGIILLGTTIILIHLSGKRKKLYERLIDQKRTIENNNNLLTQQKHELLQLHQVKDKMFSMVVHDFKTPINSLEGMLNLIIRGHLSAEEAQDLAQKMQSYVKQSKQSSDNLIKWEKSQMEGVEFSFVEIQLSEFLGEIKSYHHQLLESKQITLEVSSLDHVFISDKEILNIILNNLVSNAVKFTRPNGKIGLEGSISNDKLTMEVSDNGIGIEETELASIFELSKSVKEGTQKEKGTGLGLVICKQLVEKLSGTLSIDSQKNHGTTVRVSIPIKPID